MFTGIIEELGLIKKIRTKSSGLQFSISAKEIMDDLKIGDSLSINGVCLTVIHYSAGLLTFDLVSETLEKSNLGDLNEGDSVNLERALKVDGRFGGHIIQGHVETVGVILDKQSEKDNIILSVGLDPEWMRFCIPKGSIALDGISLTISRIEANIIEVSLIPHTLKNTTLGMKNKSDTLNVETDIIGKYVDRLLSFDNEESEIDLGILKTSFSFQFEIGVLSLIGILVSWYFLRYFR